MAQNRMTHFKFEYCARRDSLSWLAGKRNGRVKDATSYVQSQWSVGTCNDVLPLFEVAATSLGLLDHPTSLYKFFFFWGGGFPERQCVPEAYRDHSKTQTSHC